MNLHDELKPEDYREPECLLIDPQTGRPCGTNSIPADRVVGKLDEYCAAKDYAGAERHLRYWLEEARYNGDQRGEFTILNEMMGFYRKQGRKEDALAHARAAVDVMIRLGNENTVSGGTCYVNCGTVCDNFGMPEEALVYFRKAQEIYEAAAHCDSSLLGGLYNNMGLALMDTGAYRESGECFAKALDQMRETENGELEQAITYLNMADAASLEKGLEEAGEQIAGYLEEAKRLLDTPSLPRDGYYAFVCERCAPGFFCYGFADYGTEIEERAKSIYQSKMN